MEFPFKSNKDYPWLLLIISISFLAYLPAFLNGFTNWDDHFYVTQNHLIKSISLRNIYYWISKPHTGLYHPVVLFSLAIDFAIGGLNPRVFIATNLLFHLLNTLLVFHFVKKLFGDKRMAFFAMALFGVHTLHVESVAWISERKDVLFTFFFLSSLILYVRHVVEQKTRFLVLSLFLFVIALLSKAAAVTLPLCMMLVDFILGKQTFNKKALWDKMPFFILSVIMGFLTIYSHYFYGALENTTGYSFLSRVLVSAKGFTLYLINIVLPLKLSAFYPMPGLVNGQLPIILWLFIPVYILFFAIVYISYKKSKIIFFGLVFFLINLFLFLIPAGVPIVAADRFMYLPSLGLFIIISYLFIQLIQHFEKLKMLIIGIFSLYILVLSGLTFNRTKVWKDSLSLWNNAIETNGETWFPLLKRGRAYLNEDKLEMALIDFNRSITLNPEYSITYENRGYIYLVRSDYDNAILDFNKSLQINRNSFYSYKSLGFANFYQNEFNKAILNLNKAIELYPRYADAYKLRGKVNLETNNYEQACKDFKWALRLGLSDIKDREEIESLWEKYCEQKK